MNNPQTSLQLLFHRLTWPSGLVRERACVAIAELLVRPDTAEITYAYLLLWLSQQKLESVVALGLLVLIQARIQEPACSLPPLKQVEKAIGKPSLLSCELLGELYGSCQDDDWLSSLCYSEAVSANQTLNPVFEKYVCAYLPRIFNSIAESVERDFQISFRYQWASEWANLLQETGLKVTEKPLEFWVAQDIHKERYNCADMAVSEIYRSAFLRALAWAVSTRRIPLRDARIVAAHTCPIDLELWRLRPSSKPDWWPQVVVTDSEIDTTPAQIWPQVQQLWEQQAEKDWVIAQANGALIRDKINYDMEIYGIFQRYFAPHTVPLSDLVDWCSFGTIFRASYISPLRFRGQLHDVQINALAREFGGWSVVPTTGIAIPYTIPRWQFWRIERGFHLPAPFLSQSHPFFEVEGDILAMNDISADSKVPMGICRDWSNCLSEKRISGLPADMGQYTLVKRKYLEEFAVSTDSTFCWVARLTCHHRKDNYEEYKPIVDCRDFGSTRLFRA